MAEVVRDVIDFVRRLWWAALLTVMGYVAVVLLAHRFTPSYVGTTACVYLLCCILGLAFQIHRGRE